LSCISGRTVLITGASGKVGSGLALKFAEEGAKLILHYNKSANVIDNLIKSFRSNMEYYVVRCDFSKPEEVSEFIELIKSRFSGLSVLVNAVGLYDESKLSELDYSRFIHVINVNLVAVALISKELGMLMKRGGGGVIVNMICLTPLRGHKVYEGLKPSLPYVISKAGLIHLTKYLALELAPEVRVVGIAPGWIESGRLSSDLRELIKSSVPLRRAAKVDELVNLVRYVICEGGYITGSVIEFSGGL